MIELLVAMVMAVMVMSAAVGLFRSNRISFKLTNQLKELEENGRVGMDMLSKDLRGASGTGGTSPVLVWDNNDTSTVADNVRTGLNVKTGTDVVEVFISKCTEPFLITDFNENAASAPLIPMNKVAVCLDCYNAGAGTTSLANCVTSYNIRLDKDNSSYSCQQTMTGGNEQTGATPTVNLTWNNGQNIDNANRVHQCNDGVAGNKWNATAYIGYDYYYYVRADDPANPDPSTPTPQLVRYRVGSQPEVISSYIEDLQIVSGEDSNDDGTIDSWNNQPLDTTKIKTLKIYMRMKTDGIDAHKSLAGATTLANSGVSVTSDRYRRRTFTRTVRLRNM